MAVTDGPNLPQAAMSPVPSTPPVHRGAVPVQPPSWPMVLGVIAIVIGSLGILGHGCAGIVGQLMQPFFVNIARKSAQGNQSIFDAQMQITAKYLPFQIANIVVMTGLSVLLVIGGIGLAKRRAWSRGAFMTWAIIRIAYVVPASYIAYCMTTEMMQKMASAAASGAASGPAMPGGFGVFFQAMGVVGVIAGGIMVCLMPLFALVWFNIPKFKHEMAGWKTPAA